MSRREQTLEIYKEVKVVEEEKLRSQIQRICQKTLGKTFVRWNWNYKFQTMSNHAPDGKYTFLAGVKLYKIQKREREDSDDVFHRQSHDILDRFFSYAQQADWKIREDSNEILAEKITESQQDFDFELPEHFDPYFAHIFDRDPQIRIVYNAIAAAKASDFRVRNHCILWGKPACAKTEILLAFERMLGREYVVRLDATATTKAGAEEMFLNSGAMPPVIMLEEAEKCNPVNLPWLLGILDKRGEIIKTTARTNGPTRKEAKCLCIATVNNLTEFNGVMSGALSSRFQHKIYCPRPDKKVMELILRRELKEVNGDPAWINPIMDYCLNEEETNDPRRAIALLDGREKWLTGEYQDDLRAIRKAMEADKVSDFAV